MRAEFDASFETLALRFKLFEESSAVSSKTKAQVSNVMVYKRRNAEKYVRKEMEAVLRIDFFIQQNS